MRRLLQAVDAVPVPRFGRRPRRAAAAYPFGPAVGAAPLDAIPRPPAGVWSEPCDVQPALQPPARIRCAG
ncbi:hypothetical protein G6F46_015346 [Rhizopus delemar]|nr:hypothetical protein G6F61_015083 [Rhizopus arrhizus]KAG1581536.1 hypothetical protein G6F46_015346 [Rhizopus delemar]